MSTYAGGFKENLLEVFSIHVQRLMCGEHINMYN